MRLFLVILLFSMHSLNFSCAESENFSALNSEPPIQIDYGDTLTEKQAVLLAEKFVSQNGYTDLAPDKEKIAYESIGRESSLDELLKSRHNTLERKAFGVSSGRKGTNRGWTVVFKYKVRSGMVNDKNGRAVTMNLDGSEMRVEHVDFILSKVGRKL